MKKQLINSPIKKRYILLIIAVISLLIIIEGYSFYKNEEISIKKEKYNLIKGIAELKINQLTEWYSDELNDTELITLNLQQNYFISSTKNDKSARQRINKLLNEIKNLKTGFSAEQTISLVTKLEKVIISNLSFLGIAELDLTGKLQETLSHTGEWIFSHVLDAASVITSFILIPFIVFFLLKDGREFKKSFVNIVPNRYFEFTLYLFYKLNAQVGNFLRGQFIDAAIVGLMATFALWLVGLKYYFLIGLFTGIANLIPYFGPLTGAVLATILSILQTGGLQMAAYVLLAFVIIKLLDDAIVQPVVVAKSVHMNPLTVLLVILIGGKWFGILGMLLSVPVAGFLKVVFHESIKNYRRYRA